MQVTALTNNRFDVQSETNPEVAYVVERGQSCTCPHFQARLIGTGKACKHMLTVEEFLASQPQPTALEKAAEIAENLTDTELRRYAAERLGTAAGAACLLEMAERAARRQPKPIPAGVMELLAGATDEERERALAIYK